MVFVCLSAGVGRWSLRTPAHRQTTQLLDENVSSWTLAVVGLYTFFPALSPSSTRSCCSCASIFVAPKTKETTPEAPSPPCFTPQVPTDPNKETVLRILVFVSGETCDAMTGGRSSAQSLKPCASHFLPLKSIIQRPARFHWDPRNLRRRLSDARLRPPARQRDAALSSSNVVLNCRLTPADLYFFFPHTFLEEGRWKPVGGAMWQSARMRTFYLQKAIPR